MKKKKSSGSNQEKNDPTKRENNLYLNMSGWGRIFVLCNMLNNVKMCLFILVYISISSICIYSSKWQQKVEETIQTNNTFSCTPPP